MNNEGPSSPKTQDYGTGAGGDNLAKPWENEKKNNERNNYVPE